VTTITTTEEMSISTIADEIRREHQACERDAKSAVEHAIRAGGLLIEAKAQVKHGEWLTWLAQNVHFTQQTANTYMRISENYGRSRDFPPSINAALKQIAAKTYVCTKCGKHRSASRFLKGADRCNGCIAEIATSNEDAPISAYEIGDSDRKRQLAEVARERLWAAVSQCSALAIACRSAGGGIEDLLKLDRAVAITPDDEIEDMLVSINDGIKVAEQLRAELQRRLPQAQSVEVAS
jgi:ribosomal protein L37AE/L43A